MIIKIIPETPEEAKSFKSTQHAGVQEFFMCGIDQDDDGNIGEFHDWKGGYRFLIGSLAYYSEIISDERRNKMSANLGQSLQNIRILPPDEEDEEMPEMSPFPATSVPGEGLKLVTAEVEEPEIEVLEDLPEVGHDLDEKNDK